MCDIRSRKMGKCSSISPRPPPIWQKPRSNSRWPACCTYKDLRLANIRWRSRSPITSRNRLSAPPPPLSCAEPRLFSLTWTKNPANIPRPEDLAYKFCFLARNLIRPAGYFEKIVAYGRQRASNLPGKVGLRTPAVVAVGWC